MDSEDVHTIKNRGGGRGEMNVHFKAQIEFSADPEQFKRFCAAINKLPFKIGITAVGARASHESDGSDPEGVWTIPPHMLFEKEVLQRMAKGMKSHTISSKITGGIQVPHLHLDDHIVLLDQSKFQELVRMSCEKVAETLSEELPPKSSAAFSVAAHGEHQSPKNHLPLRGGEDPDPGSPSKHHTKMGEEKMKKRSSSA